MFWILEALFDAVKKQAGEAIDKQHEWRARYESYSDERLIDEWDRLGTHSSEIPRRTALGKVMKERGLRPRGR